MFCSKYRNARMSWRENVDFVTVQYFWYIMRSCSRGGKEQMLLDEILRTELGNSCACLMIVIQSYRGAFRLLQATNANPTNLL